MKRNHPLVDWSTRKSYQEACEISAWSSEVKARNDALNLFTKRTFSVAVKGSLRRASTPLTERFSGDEPKQPFHRHKEGKKRICRDNGLFDK